MEYVGRILVEDASGCRFEIHQYRERRLLSRVTRFALDTGEEVQRLDANTFLIASTRETLALIDSDE
ncbi:MAG: hypothetical protein ACJ8EH_01950 [Sphingomicrobium sp.]